MSVHCSCGRFARYDAYYGRWYCDACERRVSVEVSQSSAIVSSDRLGIGALLAARFSEPVDHHGDREVEV